MADPSYDSSLDPTVKHDTTGAVTDTTGVADLDTSDDPSVKRDTSTTPVDPNAPDYTVTGLIPSNPVLSLAADTPNSYLQVAYDFSGGSVTVNGRTGSKPDPDGRGTGRPGHFPTPDTFDPDPPPPPEIGQFQGMMFLAGPVNVNVDGTPTIFFDAVAAVTLAAATAEDIVWGRKTGWQAMEPAVKASDATVLNYDMREIARIVVQRTGESTLVLVGDVDTSHRP